MHRSVELDIDSGLTGIVEPNVCGKSNVVEGLRWLMGESSARQMRGGEMDDIIFLALKNDLLATSPRSPSRSTMLAPCPAEFNDVDGQKLQDRTWQRRLLYVNAKPAQTHDITLLFADIATGAKSSGIVSQGRMGAIVDAKPLTGEP